MGIFMWLRHQIKAAVLLGLADALAEVDPVEGADPLASLRQRLTALPVPPPAEEGEAVEAGNGRRRKGVAP